MKKAILTVAAAVTLAAAAMTAPTPANAYCHHCGWGYGGAAVLGGLAAGAIIGSAIASHPGYYGYEYDHPAPVDCDGYWARRRLYDRYGNFIGWSRPHYFCR